MNKQSKITIVGAGPSGASLACRLTRQNFDVCLIEREKFPRHKLCGEFISPECLEHFQELEVLDEMLSVGGDRITETVFYAPSGRSVTVPSKWFNFSQDALSISRAEMDLRLLEKAKTSGVKVFEETSVVGILFENNEVCGVKAKSKNGETFEIAADLTIDATGRSGFLAKFAKKLQITDYKFQNKIQIANRKSQIANRLVGFKTHLENVNLEKGVCEIYFFRGGYGGLSYVENGLANHCFLIKAEVVKEFGSDAQRIVEKVIFQNSRARATMEKANAVFDWLAVSVDGFGVKNLNPAPNLFAVGDAAAFIDPFTGSGMLMALESGEILAQAITENRFSPKDMAENYQILYRRKFQNRLRVCSLLRRAAFAPFWARAAISVLSLSGAVRQILARSTRQKFSDSGK